VPARSVGDGPRLAKPKPAAAGVLAGPTGSVGGRPALRLDGAQGSWWIALSGPPHPLRLESRLAVDGPVQRLELSEFDREVDVTASRDPVDLAGRG
jgi:hypothetical protein